MEEPRTVSFSVPGARVLKLVALGCFVLDIVGGAAGIGDRVHLLSLGFALWVAADIFAP